MRGCEASRLKVLHCIRSLDPAGGGTTDFVRMVGRLQSSFGIVAEAVTIDAPSEPWLAETGMKTHALGPGGGRFGYCSSLVGWLKDHLDDYNILVVNGIWNYMSAAVSMACRSSSFPYVIFADGMLDPWFARTYPLKHIKKQLYWWLVEGRVLSEASAVLFTSEEELTRARYAFRPYRLNAIVTGYGTSDFEGERQNLDAVFLRHFPELSTRRYLLFLGRVHEKKGLDLLVRAFSELQTSLEALDLVIAGPVDDSYKKELQDIIDHYPASTNHIIRWIPPVASDAKWALLSHADAMILPSHQENFGRVVSEALSCQTPVLISDKVNIWKTIQDESAAITANDDLEGTKSLVLRWMELSDSGRQAMRVNARRCYEKHFDARVVFAGYLEILNRFARPTVMEPPGSSDGKLFHRH